jgi:hypothetical protein
MIHVDVDSSSGLMNRVNVWSDADVSGVHSASIVSAEASFQRNLFASNFSLEARKL